MVPVDVYLSVLSLSSPVPFRSPRTGFHAPLQALRSQRRGTGGIGYEGVRSGTRYWDGCQDPGSRVVYRGELPKTVASP